MVVHPQSVGPGDSWAFACPSPSSLLWFCKFRWVLFSPMVHTLRDGVAPAGPRLVCPRLERKFTVFSLSFWAVSSCCHCPSGCGHHMGQVLVWRARRWSWVLRPFSLWLGFEPLSEASLRALSYWWVSWWSSLRPRAFGFP